MSNVEGRILDTLRQPNYGRYAAGNAVSLVGTWVQRVAVGWLTWDLTHSGTWLGIVAFADLAPAVLLGPLGGAVADRLPPVRITLVCQALAMLQSAALCLLTALGLITPTLLAGLILAQGIVMGFVQPARLSLVYALVPRDHLPTAIAINSVVFNTARFIGPAIAGFVLVTSGPALAFGLNTASFLAFIVALTSLSLARAPVDAGVRRSLLRDVYDGARYAFGHDLIGPILIFSIAVSVSLRPYVELLPGFADAVLGGGAAELAILSSAIGLGAMLAGTWLARRGAALVTVRFVVLCAGVASVAVIGFAVSRHIVPAAACVFVAGGAMVLAGVTTQTLLQLNVAPALRGRVMSLYGLVFRSGPAIGALLMGIASEWVGLSWPVAVGASLALVAGAGFWHRYRDMNGATDRRV